MFIRNACIRFGNGMAFALVGGSFGLGITSWLFPIASATDDYTWNTKMVSLCKENGCQTVVSFSGKLLPECWIALALGVLEGVRDTLLEQRIIDKTTTYVDSSAGHSLSLIPWVVGGTFAAAGFMVGVCQPIRQDRPQQLPGVNIPPAPPLEVRVEQVGSETPLLAGQSRQALQRDRLFTPQPRDQRSAVAFTHSSTYFGMF